MNFQFLVFDHVEELDLVGSWEMVGLLAEQKQCSSPRLVTLNAMTPVGEHGMRFVADVHFSEMDMMLAFIAHSFGHDVAASIQLSAEYFPTTTMYGRPFERSDVSEYIRVLGENA